MRRVAVVEHAERECVCVRETGGMRDASTGKRTRRPRRRRGGREARRVMGEARAAGVQREAARQWETLYYDLYHL